MLQRPVTSLILFLGVLVGSSDTALLFADEPLKNPDAELRAIVKEWGEAKQAKFERYGERCFQLVETYPRSSAAMRALVFVVGKTPNTPQATHAIELLKPRVAEADLEYLGKHLGWVFPYGMADLAPLVFTKAKSKPEDPYAPSVVVWVCLATDHGNSNKLFREAVEYLLQHYGDSLHPWSVLQYIDLAQEPDTAWAERQLHAILAVNKTDQVRRLAAYTLAALLARKGEATQAEAEQWIRECLRISEGMEAKNVDRTEGEAKLLLEKIQRFGLGKPAPDIIGQDLDSRAFKLSDYRGKVVLLDFWGFW